MITTELKKMQLLHEIHYCEIKIKKYEIRIQNLKATKHRIEANQNRKNLTSLTTCQNTI